MVKAAKVGMLIKADGSMTPIVPSKGGKFSLKELQDLVGGYIERVRIPGNKVLIVDEEGIPKGLPFNRAATEATGRMHEIYGTAVILPRGMGW
jgi:hypothetical protein